MITADDEPPALLGTSLNAVGGRLSRLLAVTNQYATSVEVRASGAVTVINHYIYSTREGRCLFLEPTETRSW